MLNGTLGLHWGDVQDIRIEKAGEGWDLHLLNIHKSDFIYCLGFHFNPDNSEVARIYQVGGEYI